MKIGCGPWLMTREHAAKTPGFSNRLAERPAPESLADRLRRDTASSLVLVQTTMRQTRASTARHCDMRFGFRRTEPACHHADAHSSPECPPCRWLDVRHRQMS